jgi:hypothetical protein
MTTLIILAMYFEWCLRNMCRRMWNLLNRK